MKRKVAKEKIQKQHKQKGFSLVETVIYLGLLVLIMISIVSMIIGMSRAYSFLKQSVRIQSSAVTSLDKMIREMRNAKSVDLANSTLDTSPGVLTLNTTTDAGADQTIQFYAQNGVLRIKKDEVDQGPLSLTGVTFSSLLFRHITTGISEAVKIELVLSAGQGSSERSAPFYGTAILRDSY
ncbi:MAG: hypothetical protein NUV54_00630 [Candidatus Taylorbacteria bacterium]|nr:hypothetical protein [Candidatus Taylorbacteria bacterium]